MSANPLVSHGTNLAQGFETFVELPWDAKTRRWSAAAEVNRRFLDWLALNHQHRFVAWLQYMEPHDPYFVHPYNGEAYARVANPNPDPALAVAPARGAHGPSFHPSRSVLRGSHDGEIHSWDAELPALLAGLDRLGCATRR